MTARLSSPHIHQPVSIQQVMKQVIIAMVPGIVAAIWILGWGVLVQCLLAVSFALLFEAIMLKLRRQPVRPFLFDGSVIITALLFALAITPFSPWWINLTGVGFAVIVVKHLYGGLGYNLFNPAMAGYIFVLLCFPVEMNHWPALPMTPGDPHGLAETLSVIFTGDATVADGISGATPLGYMKSQIAGMAMISEFNTSPLFGMVGGRGWEWMGLAWLAGGIWLLVKKIIQWHLPAAFLSSLFLISLVLHWSNADIYASPLFHIFSGGVLIAAFFIITDPVTTSATPRGKLVFAAGAAFIILLIRNWGAYPDGIAFAVLIMNAAVPLIDRLTRPGIFGES